jgi:hypothetical protein
MMKNYYLLLFMIKDYYVFLCMIKDKESAHLARD